MSGCPTPSANPKCVVCGDSTTQPPNICTKCSQPCHSRCAGKKLNAPCDRCRKDKTVEQRQNQNQETNVLKARNTPVVNRVSIHLRTPLSASSPANEKALQGRGVTTSASRSQPATGMKANNQRNSKRALHTKLKPSKTPNTGEKEVLSPPSPPGRRPPKKNINANVHEKEAAEQTPSENADVTLEYSSKNDTHTGIHSPEISGGATPQQQPPFSTSSVTPAEEISILGVKNILIPVT